MTAELTVRTGLPAVPARPLVHDAVRDQLIEDLTGDQRHWPPDRPNRLDRLHAILDAPTFNEVLLWLASSKRASTLTKRGYADDLAKIAEWAAEHYGVRPVPLLQILTSDALGVWSTYTRSQGWAVRTERRTLSAVSSLFGFAARHGWPVANPVDFEDHARPVGTSNTGRPAGATSVLEPEQAAAMYLACRTDEERLVFDLLHLHGMRETEVVKVLIDNVDRTASPMRITFERKRGQWITRDLLPRTQQVAENVMAGRTEGPLLVDPKTGKARTRHQIIDLTRRLARRAGLPNPNKITPHVLRATAITGLLDDRQPIQEVQIWAGHANPKTTQAYWERRNSVRRDAALTGRLVSLLDIAAANLAEDVPTDTQ